jgi:hypothetical protein
MVIKKMNAPKEILEMSFYKLLEQFFYNDNVRTQLINAKGNHCTHNFHLDTSLIFRYGPIKIMLNYE